MRISLVNAAAIAEYRVAWLIVPDPNEAAAAGGLEGAPRAVNRVGDVHEP